MKERKTKTTTDNLIDVLFKHEISNAKPGKEWFSVWDIAKKYSISRSHASKKIAAFLRSGVMEMKRFRVGIDNAQRVVPHYRVK